MNVVHACWIRGRLHLWAEAPNQAPFPTPSSPASPPTPSDQAEAATALADADVALHPAAAPAEAIKDAIRAVAASAEIDPEPLLLHLPAATIDNHTQPLLSPRLAHATGHTLAEELEGELVIDRFRVPSVVVEAADAARVLDALEAEELDNLIPGSSVRFFAAVARFVRYLLANQRFVPMMEQAVSGQTRSVWRPWLADEQTLNRLKVLIDAMPPIARAAIDPFEHDVWPILEDMLSELTDAACRSVIAAEELHDALDGANVANDDHAAWLTGLLTGDDLDLPAERRTRIVKGVRTWISTLQERGIDSDWHLMLTVHEPVDLGQLTDFAPPGEDIRWQLTLGLQSEDDPDVVLTAADVWSLPPGPINAGGRQIDNAHDLLLAELARAARIYKPFEKLLDTPEPIELELTTRKAYEFLREIRPVLTEQGFTVRVPEWWDSPTVRVGARLQIESGELDLAQLLTPSAAVDAAGSQVGMNSLVSYSWQLAVGDTLLTMEQFEQLANQRSPLILVDGKWVEVRTEDIRSAMKFIQDNPGGDVPLSKALRLALSSEPEEAGITILGMDATGWAGAILSAAANRSQLPDIDPPEGFVGTLRPYQTTGLSWLVFLDRIGLGACLADDMGLGKTIQLLALMQHELNALKAAGVAPEDHTPSLLVVPMSVVGNWVREAQRFTPDLRVLVHHGPDRITGEGFAAHAKQYDLVVTTYALANRDQETLAQINWTRVVLDEAQNIKNPTSKQSQAIRELDTHRRITLTGTPVENRLSELWSIMDFLNPDYLGSVHDFKRRFAVPIEKYHDKQRSTQLRTLVQPFILRRLKSDPNVMTDLPEKVETKEYCYLTSEQAALYETCVKDMLSAADRAAGIQRRGMVLAGLVKLKQICNHPAQFLKEDKPMIDPTRSGKTLRLREMLDEVVSAGDQALVFTQFRQMGHMLAAQLAHDLDRDVLFLHGGTPAAKRQQLIERFQRADGTAPIFLLSLKAGGVGLNLTAATHVFHFDRWWNPAVEAQATDRAYRIGQTRTVQVHKFVASGTLEERIDAMIESKTKLAQQVIGSGEDWLTELSTDQLKDLLTLRKDAIANSSDDESDLVEI